MSPDEIFSQYWRAQQGDGNAEAMHSDMRPITAAVPHAVSIEAGEMLLAAWIGDMSEPEIALLVPRLWDSAKRIVASSGLPEDGFEAAAWRVLNRGLDRSEASDKQDDDEEDDQEEDTSGVARWRLSLIRIELVGTAKNIPMFMPQYIFLDGRTIPIQQPLLKEPPSPSRVLTVNLKVQDRLQQGYTSAHGNHMSLALVRMGDLYDLAKLGNPIYEENVRGFIGSGSVTNRRLQAIYAEIGTGAGSGAETGSMFPLLNNGITICHIGDNAVGNTITLVSPQVINGQQTLRSWHHAYELANGDAKQRMADIQVVARIVRLARQDDAKKIAFANNRQNSVTAIDLRSNEACIKEVEACFMRRGSKYLFRRKAGQPIEADDRPTIHAGHIYAIHAALGGDERDSEAFFDSDSSFNSLFQPLAKRLTDPVKVDRLIGLHIVNRIPTGTKKGDGVVDLLRRLRVRQNAFGDLDGNAASVEKRLLVYALWPNIRCAILHLLLKNPVWLGVDRKIVVFTKSGRPQRFVASDSLVALIDGVRLPTDLITDFWAEYREWKLARPDEHEEALVKDFAKQEVSLGRMLNLVGTTPADLALDI